MSNCLFHYLYQTFPIINLLNSYTDKLLFSNLLTLHISRKSDSGFASAVQKPNTASDSVEEDSGESVKSEDREQLNSFQENCDERVECTKLCLKLFSRCSIADVKLPISLFISDISYY
jgi:hypothetical protein